MNKKLFTILLFVLIVFPTISQARNISELKGINLVSYDEINEECLQPEGFDPVSGCYIAQTDEIYIRNDLPQGRLLFVLWHELGHFFMKNITTDEYESVFNPTPAKRYATIMPEIACDYFALYVMGGRVPNMQKDFFNRLLNDKN